MARQGEGGCRVPPAAQEFSGSRSPGRASLEPQDSWCALLLPIRRSLRKGDGGGGGVLRQGSCPQGGSWETEVPRSVGSPGPGSAGSSQERAGATSSGDSAPGGWGRWEEGPREDATRLPVGGGAPLTKVTNR